MDFVSSGGASHILLSPAGLTAAFKATLEMTGGKSAAPIRVPREREREGEGEGERENEVGEVQRERERGRERDRARREGTSERGEK